MPNEKQPVILFIVFTTTLIFFFAGIIFFQQRSGSSSGQGSQLGLTEVKKDTKPTPSSEILQWKMYSNNQYAFAVEMPGEWKIQDYAPSYPAGGTLVAFSPDPLPCPSCTYFRSGYFSVKVYSQQTDPEGYALFQQRLQAAGKSPEYQQATLGKKPAVAYGNVVAGENNGWVYEVSLDAESGNANPADSKVFKRVVESFSYTDVLLGS